MDPEPSPTLQSFRELSRDIVREFLQTAVVLDDEAVILPRTSSGPFVEPDLGVSTPEAIPDDDDAQGETGERAKGNSLDARALIDAFAGYGMVCAVLTPWQDDDGDDPTCTASRRADIVVLDWRLRDEGQRASRIIRQITDEDAQSGGRLRLIALYTAERDLNRIRDCLASKLPRFSRGRSAPYPTLDADHARIVFISKGRTSEAYSSAIEPDLPERLIEEFADFGKGLLANVTLGAIASIRRGTHQLLARFHSGLDAPFVSHRILLETPDDAAQLPVELLHSELAVLLQDSNIGPRFAGKEAIRAFLTEITSGGSQLRLMSAKNSELDPQVLSVEQLMHLVESGPAGLNNIQGRQVAQNQMDQLHHRVELLLARDLDAGRAVHREFARLSSRAREQALVSPDYRPKLDLGSVVRSDQRYLLCIQPRCDAVRLNDSTRFVFAHLTKSDSRFDLVVQDGDSDVALKLEESVAELRHYTFEPDPVTRTVLAATDRCFTDAKGRSFTWLCDLRGPIAQRFLQRVASSLSRIALDEFEWQRRHAKG